MNQKQTKAKHHEEEKTIDGRTDGPDCADNSLRARGAGNGGAKAGADSGAGGGEHGADAVEHDGDGGADGGDAVESVGGGSGCQRPAADERRASFGPIAKDELVECAVRRPFHAILKAGA